jgi:hypothetical protein
MDLVHLPETKEKWTSPAPVYVDQHFGAYRHHLTGRVSSTAMESILDEICDVEKLS